MTQPFTVIIARLARLGRCPPCPESDRVLRCRKISRCAMKRHAQRFAPPRCVDGGLSLERRFSNRSSAPVLLADLGKHVVKCGRMPERSEGDRLTRRLRAVG